MDDRYDLRRVLLTRIVPSRWQPREPVFDGERLWELARSIEEQGLINAVVVFPVEVEEDPSGFGKPQGSYELVAGERRVRAVLGIEWGKMAVGLSGKAAVEALAREGLAGLPSKARELLEAAGARIMARVEPAEDLGRLHRMAVVENIERESLGPLEEARALQGLVDGYGWSQRELARRLGKSQSYVAQRLSLLGLSQVAQEAVSTRVLSASHARAIARVPVALQPAVTGWVTAAVKLDDSTVTTRKVQNLARQVAAFVKPERWEPQVERVYTPNERNWLALIAWAVERADLEECGEALLNLRAVGYADTNWLRKSPLVLVRGSALGTVLEALGLQRERAWEVFAEETGRGCGSCVFGEIEPVVGLMLHCPRWRGGTMEVCKRFIGADDPVVIPVGYRLRPLFEELGVEMEEVDGEQYVASVEDYVEWCRRAVVLEAERVEMEASRKATAHLVEIREFMDWQKGRTVAELGHFQAHACRKCAMYCVDQEPPCLFAVEPLKSYGDRVRAPEFRVLVMEDGRMLPRCEQFCYQEVPALLRVAGMRFGDRKMAVEWLHGIGIVGGGYGRSMLRGVLRWLDYGRGVGEANDWEMLKRWVKREWEELGGDEVVATLLDVALSEVREMKRSRGDVVRLLNGVTGEVEEFGSVDFAKVASGEDVRRWERWPEGWGKPWIRG
jgi:ParB-like chromosome segregation protein Spo0J